MLAEFLGEIDLQGMVQTAVAEAVRTNALQQWLRQEDARMRLVLNNTSPRLACQSIATAYVQPMSLLISSPSSSSNSVIIDNFSVRRRHRPLVDN